MEYEISILDGFVVNMDEKHATYDVLCKVIEKAEAVKNKALLENEIISSVSKLYFAIFRIDLLHDFYEEVSPKLAFFDAPDWLMYDETGKYTTPENAKEMESLGSEVVSFHTQPNTVSIE